MPYRNSKPHSALTYVLKGLIPYSRENLLLTYKPNKFFNELKRISDYRQSTLRNAYWRGKQRGLIDEDDYKIPKLTEKGLKKVKPFIVKKLGKKSKLVVIFDIPESDKLSRDKLRNLLKAWGFVQVQKSVWSSDLDFIEALSEVIDELSLRDCIEVYEALRLLPKWLHFIRGRAVFAEWRDISS